ncbi:hypothetical protein [Streptomyces sp. NPDC001966]
MLGEVAAAGSEQVMEVFDRPDGEDAGAGEVEADGVDPVDVGGIEEEVSGELPGGALGHLFERVAGALEVEQQAVDDEVGIGCDAGAGERRAAVAVLGPGPGPYVLKGAVGGLVELVDDVVDHVGVRELKQAGEGGAAGVLQGGLGQRGEGEADGGAGQDLVPGRGDEHAGQVLFLVLGAVEGKVAVVEVEVLNRLGQAGGELVADRAHPQPLAVAAEPAGELNPFQSGVVDGRVCGEGRAPG